jgi:hypothetical protein
MASTRENLDLKVHGNQGIVVGPQRMKETISCPVVEIKYDQQLKPHRMMPRPTRTGTQR